MPDPTGPNPALSAGLQEVFEQIRELTAVITELARESVGGAATEAIVGLSREVARMAGAATTAGAAAQTLHGSLATLSAGIARAGAVSAFAFNELTKFTSAVTGTMGQFVEAFSPVYLNRFTYEVKNLNAAIGEMLVGPMERFKLVVRGIGDTFASVTPEARKMIAALAAASVGAVVLGGAVAALSVVINSATAGIPAIIGAVVGGTAALAGGMGLLSGTMQQLQGVIRQVMTVGRGVLNALGEAFQTVFKAVQPLFGALAGLAKEMAGPITAFIKQAATNMAEFVGGLVPVVTGLLPVLSQLGQAFLQLNTGIMRVVMAAVKPLLAAAGALAPVVQMLLMPLTQGLQLFGAMADVFTSLLNPAVDVLLTPLKLVGELAAMVAGELNGAFGELQSAFREVGKLANDIGRDISLAFKELMTAFRPLFAELAGPFLTGLHALTGMARGAASAIKFLVDSIRDLLGLPAVGGDAPFRHVEAARGARTDSAEGYLRKMQEHAMSAGNADPQQATAKHTSTMAQAMKNIADDVREIKNKLLQAKETVEELPGRAANTAGGAGWWAARELGSRVFGR